MLRNLDSGLCYNPGNFRSRRSDGGKMEPCATGRPFRGNTQYLWNTQADEILINPPHVRRLSGPYAAPTPTCAFEPR